MPRFDPSQPDQNPGPRSNALFLADDRNAAALEAAAGAMPAPLVFAADASLLRPRVECRRTPVGQLLKRTGISGNDCAFMPLRRMEPYATLHIAMLTDVIVTLNRSLHQAHPDTKWAVMPWAGSLLGAFRDTDMIPHTFDGDIVVPPELSQALRNERSSVVDALFEAGLYTFVEQATLRFCYHERAPLMRMSPGPWGACGTGSYISSRDHTCILALLSLRGYATFHYECM